MLNTSNSEFRVTGAYRKSVYNFAFQKKETWLKKQTRLKTFHLELTSKAEFYAMLKNHPKATVQFTDWSSDAWKHGSILGQTRMNTNWHMQCGHRNPGIKFFMVDTSDCPEFEGAEELQGERYIYKTYHNGEEVGSLTGYDQELMKSMLDKLKNM